VLFHGEPDGHFQAYDARNGELLWQWQPGAGASANGDMVWAFSLRGGPNNRIAQFEAPGDRDGGGFVCANDGRCSGTGPPRRTFTGGSPPGRSHPVIHIGASSSSPSMSERR
jgi:hypothetical protein